MNPKTFHRKVSSSEFTAFVHKATACGFLCEAFLGSAQVFFKAMLTQSHKTPLTQTRKAAQGFCFTEESEFKRAETKLRKKHSAEKGWKQDVSNPPLSRSDLAGNPTKRRAFRVSFVRAAYGATAVKQNPGEE
ncbi:hypothetical protein [Desulfitobacterium hafniense]|uniref:hypothetical protein n=1 Tax=Desulfitobacterium hafniense TaxID=49338 RepID=UPI001651C4EC|nr:hypothetical protein [Desulfitobacterium hafniense]